MICEHTHSVSGSTGALALPFPTLYAEGAFRMGLQVVNARSSRNC
jgi:hypothetical protein